MIAYDLLRKGGPDAKTSTPFKVPKDIEFRESLPKTLIGKTLRRQLAEEDRKKRGQVAATT